MSEVFVSPDGAHMEVSSPAAKIRMRARGWRPESEVTPAPKPARARKPVQPADSSEPAES